MYIYTDFESTSKLQREKSPAGRLRVEKFGAKKPVITRGGAWECWPICVYDIYIYIYTKKNKKYIYMHLEPVNVLYFWG